jgi:serine/threonine protein kinase
MSLDTSRVEELFYAAQAIATPDEQRAWLDQACAGDLGLRGRVEALLSAAAEASQFLNKPAVEIAGAEVTQGLDGSSVNSGRSFGRRDTEKGEALSFLQPTSRPDSLGRLGHYEVLEVIGQGGFGIVLRAFDEKLHRVVALKVLAPELAANGSARKRFVREARTAAAVKNEHVVGIYGVEENAQPPYLAMEMIDGKSLQEKIDQQGPLSLTEILRIGLQMGEGLAAAHKQGLVHRDIKPANILLENGVERVKITDFGLARAVDDASVTQSGTVAGTPMYMSPEQAEGLAIDHRSDLFSLGTVLYAMCTGHSAFRGSNTHAVLKRVIEAAPRPIREVNSEVPEWLCDIITKLHAKRPEDRFQTAKDVAELLGQHLAHLQQPSHSPRPAPVKVPAAKAEVETKGEPDGGPVLSGLTLVLSTVRTLIVYWVVIGLLLALGGQLFGWHWRTICRGGSAFFGIIALSIFVQALFINGAKRPAWVRALSQAAFSIGTLAFGLGVVAAFDWISPAPDPIPVPAIEPQGAAKPPIAVAPSGASKAKDEKAEPDKWIDLLKLADTKADVVSGPWKLEGGSLVSDDEPDAKIALPIFPMGDYQLIVKFRRIKDEGGGPIICLPVGARSVQFATYHPIGVCALEAVDGAYVDNPANPTQRKAEPIRADKLRTADIRVSMKGDIATIRVEMDGKRVIDFAGHPDRFSLNPAWSLGDDRRVGLRAWEGFRFESVQLKMLTGEARLLRKPKEPIETGFIPLLNEKDLTGWKESTPGTWKIADSHLIGKGDQAKLRTDRFDFEDFHLRLEAKYVGGEARLLLRGQEANIGEGYEIFMSNKAGELQSGSVLSVSLPDKQGNTGSMNEARTKEGEWFTLEVIARGPYLQTIVNGESAVDFLDPSNSPVQKGCLRLTVIGSDAELHLRKFEINEFKSHAMPPLEMTALREAIIALQRSRDVSQAQFAAGQVTGLAVVAAEAELCEARIRLAEVESTSARVLSLLTELVKWRAKAREQVEQRVLAGVEPTSALTTAETHLADAKVRLARAEAALKAPSPKQARP